MTETRFRRSEARLDAGTIPALKGLGMVAQGAALGTARRVGPQALKGRDNGRSFYPALTGLALSLCSNTQGCALGYRMSAFQAKEVNTTKRSAFTLFELILAITLSVALLALIGTAINLYLLRVDAGRTRVEEAQLARSVLAMIADDLRATAVYQAQDTSGVASLVANSADFDVDSIDEASPSGGGTSGPTGASGVSSAQSIGSSSGSSSQFGGSSTGSTANDGAMPLGLNGTLAELYIDIDRLPSREELFQTVTGYTNTQSVVTAGSQSAATPKTSDVKTVRYFVRPGNAIGSGGASIRSLASDQQFEAGGLVRQQLHRHQRVFAEVYGDQALLESGQALIAPEVVHIEFRYFDGSRILDYWDMTEMGGLPPAIEVRIWIMPADVDDASSAMPNDLANIMNKAHEYRQIVFLPMWSVGGDSASAGGATGESDESTSSSSSASSSQSDGTGASSSSTP